MTLRETSTLNKNAAANSSILYHILLKISTPYTYEICIIYIFSNETLLNAIYKQRQKHLVNLVPILEILLRILYYDLFRCVWTRDFPRFYVATKK